MAIRSLSQLAHEVLELFEDLCLAAIPLIDIGLLLLHVLNELGGEHDQLLAGGLVAEGSERAHLFQQLLRLGPGTSYQEVGMLLDDRGRIQR